MARLTVPALLQLLRDHVSLSEIVHNFPATGAAPRDMNLSIARAADHALNLWELDLRNLTVSTRIFGGNHAGRGWE